MELFDKIDEGKTTSEDKETPSVDDMLKGEDTPGTKDTDEDVVSGDEDEDTDKDEVDEGDEDTEEDEVTEEDEDKSKVDRRPEPPEPTEDDVITNRPTYAALKKAYPNIFKDHPELRSILFREPEYAKIFPTIKEARETAAYADTVRQVEQSLAEGDPEILLKSVMDASPQMLATLAENIPATLYKLSQESYVKMTTPIIRNAIILARQHARGVQDKDLWNGLDHIEKFLFGDHRFSLKKEEPKGDPLKAEREQLDRERRDLHMQRARGFENRVRERSEAAFKREILRGLDPQKTLTPRMRDLIAEQALTEVGGRMSKDNAHLSSMNTLWRRAAQQGLSPESEEQLIRAWLSRARPLIGPVRRKLLAEIVGRSEQPNTEGKPSTDGGKMRPPRVPVGKDRGSARASLSGLDPRKVDYSKTSDADILAGKVTLKK
jgi:hypothetical protein